jgi:hypothetical protein
LKWPEQLARMRQLMHSKVRDCLVEGYEYLIPGPALPDEFIAHPIDLNPAWVLAAVARHRASLKNPPKSRDDYLDTLFQQGLPETVSQSRQRAIAF